MSDNTDKQLSGNSFLFEWHSFVAALGLMTRIPIRRLGGKALVNAHYQRSQSWYPAAGLLIGALLILCLWVFPSNLSPLIQAALILILWIVITGALHLDGLADMADAWAGGMGDKQRTLDIMKDPACGPHAVITLVLSLLLKYLLILALVESSGWILLLVVPMLARGWLLPLLANTAYVGGGMAKGIAEISPKLWNFYGSLGLSFILLCIVLPLGLWVWLVANLFAAGLILLIRYSTVARIGGYTGDVLGAAVELNEIALLLAAVILLS